jgi:hypothetical protein
MVTKMSNADFMEYRDKLVSQNDISDEMAQRDRVSIDISGIKEDLEAARNDVAWAEMSLSQKIRVALREWIEAEAAKRVDEEK